MTPLSLFPLCHLCMYSPFVSVTAAAASHSLEYSLVGLIEHTGHLKSGHYVAYVRRSADPGGAMPVGGAALPVGTATASASDQQAGGACGASVGGQGPGRDTSCSNGGRPCCASAVVSAVAGAAEAAVAMAAGGKKDIKRGGGGGSTSCGNRAVQDLAPPPLQQYDWFQVNDTVVRRVTVAQVVSAQAYILCYVRQQPGTALP